MHVYLGRDDFADTTRHEHNATLVEAVSSADRANRRPLRFAEHLPDQNSALMRSTCQSIRAHLRGAVLSAHQTLPTLHEPRGQLLSIFYILTTCLFPRLEPIRRHGRGT
jgi:hypothetical protein